MRLLLEIIFKRKKAIFLIAAFSLVFAFLGNVFSTPMYKSEAKVHIGLGREITLPTKVLNQPLNVYFDRNEQVNTQIELLKSRHLTEKTLRELPGIEEEPTKGFLNSLRKGFSRFISISMGSIRSALVSLKIISPSTEEQREIIFYMSRINVERAKNTEILNITFSHHDPEFARIYLERYLENYFGMISVITGDRESMMVFSKQADEINNNLQVANEKLSQFRRQWNIYNLQAQKENLAHEITNTTAEQRRVKTEIQAAQAKIEEFERGLEVEAENAIPAELRTDYTIIELLKNLVSLKVQLNRMIQHHGALHPDVVGMNFRISNLRSRISDEVRGILQNQLLAWQRKKDSLEAQLTIQKNLAQLLDEKGLEMEAYEREVALLKHAVINYSERRETSRVNTVLDNERISSVSLVQPPLSPLKPSSPRYFLNLLLAAILGLLFGIVFAFSAEHLSGTVNTPDEMRRLLNVSTLVFVPDMKEINQVKEG